MKTVLSFGMAAILCAALAFTLMGGTRRDAPRRGTARADVPAGASEKTSASDATTRTDCHEGDLFMDGAPTYELHRGQNAAITRVKVIDGTDVVTILPSSVSVTEPIEGDPEFFSYDACDKSVRIVTAKANDLLHTKRQ